MNKQIQKSLRISNQIGNLLTDALKLSNNSTFQLSKNINVSVSTVSMWYRAGAYPNLESLKKLEKFIHEDHMKQGGQK